MLMNLHAPSSSNNSAKKQNKKTAAHHSNTPLVQFAVTLIKQSSILCSNQDCNAEEGQKEASEVDEGCYPVNIRSVPLCGQ